MGLSSSKTRPGDLMALGIEFAPRVGASSRSQLHEFLVFDGAFGANGLGGGGRDGARWCRLGQVWCFLFCGHGGHGQVSNQVRDVQED